jgi:hypothetical protein
MWHRLGRSSLYSPGWPQAHNPPSSVWVLGLQIVNHHTWQLGCFWYQKQILELGMVVHFCNPSTWEAETGGSQDQSLSYIVSLRQDPVSKQNKTLTYPPTTPKTQHSCRSLCSRLRVSFSTLVETFHLIWEHFGTYLRPLFRSHRPGENWWSVLEKSLLKLSVLFLEAVECSTSLETFQLKLLAPSLGQ